MNFRKEKYFTLTQLMGKVDLKERALKYRMNVVKIKYKSRTDLLYKTGRNWNIHESIIFEFDRKLTTKGDNELHNQTLVSVSPKGNYSVESLIEVVKETFNQLTHIKNNLQIRYYVENGERSNLTHVHFIVNLSMDYKSVIRRASQFYIDSNIDIRPVHLERNLLCYLEKEVREKGLLN
jgi:hypothetical protein